ncbi:MAG: hypothetical protein ACLPYS_03245 [Vulcanimicrobiaceae bacterium]
MKQGLWLALSLLVAIPLLGAVSVGPEPVVVVYPFTASGGSDAQAGSNIAILYSTRLTQLGGIDVKPYTPGTDRPQYLTAAEAMGVDYYVSGFITPIGGAQVSIVTQLVSVSSGTVVYSATTLATTYADAASEADALHDVILAHAQRAFAQLDAPRPSPTPTPIGKGGVDVAKVLGRHQRATPAPSASPLVPAGSTASVSAGSASPAAPSLPTPAVLARNRPAASGHAALLFDVAGDPDATARSSTLAALGKAFQRAGLTSGHLPVGAAEVSHAGAICQANAGARALYAPTLTLQRSPQGAPLSVQLDVVGYDCSGAKLASAHVVEPVRRRLGDALSTAAASAVATLLAASK